MSDSSTNIRNSGAASEPASDSHAACEHLRSNIARLRSELAHREAEDRPMPSSVMRAYQKLLDRQYSALEAETARQQGQPDT